MKYLTVILISFLLSACGTSESVSDQNPRDLIKNNSVLSLEDSKKLITPTVYYVPQYDQSNISCSVQKDMKAKDGHVIVRVCKDIYDSCLLQGTCQIKKDGQKYLINVASQVNGERRFSVVPTSVCAYGKGAVRDSSSAKAISVMCLDPYYSVAADLSLYNLGDVIYIPSVSGMRLPDGSIHEGYFVVRDTGGGIKGYGRFDFFSGFDSHKSDKNPLAIIDFTDKRTNVPYFVVKGSKAEEILKQRNYPLLSVSK